MNDHSTMASDTARQDNVERILECAERVFKHYGYSKTNVADIAKELSMSPANIYRSLRRRPIFIRLSLVACWQLSTMPWPRAQGARLRPQTVCGRIRFFSILW